MNERNTSNPTPQKVADWNGWMHFLIVCAIGGSTFLAIRMAGGLDGIIKEDKLGLDVVCIQAKRWDDPVGRPVVQGFVGSMDYVRARKGVILTTSRFTAEALDYVERIEGKKVVLVGGEHLSGAVTCA